LKSIKISDDIHKKIKEFSTQKGKTIDGVLRELVEKAEAEKAEITGGKTEPEPISTTGGKVENGVENGGGKVEYVTREEFTESIDEVWNGLARWSHELLENLKKVGIDLTEEGQNATKQNC